MNQQPTHRKPPLTVGSDVHTPIESVLQQISTMDQAQLSELLRAIAHRIYPISNCSYRRNRN